MNIDIQEAFPDDDEGRKVSLVGMVFLGFLTGIIAGLGAWGFRMLIGLIHNGLFHGEPWNPIYDANKHTLGIWSSAPWSNGEWEMGPWVILVPAIPSPLVAWLVLTFAPEAKGHGVPEVINAVHYKKGIIRPVVAAVKSLCSALSIGSGGSVGREGPIVQIGSAFGSTLGQVLGLRSYYKRILIACGAAGGIGATFNAPLGGILFSVELLLPSVQAFHLLPVGISAVTATNIGRNVLSMDPAFVIPQITNPSPYLENVTQLLFYFPMGIVIGVASLIFLKCLYVSEDFFESFKSAKYYGQHFVGMCMQGALFYSLYKTWGHYSVDGVGYSTINDLLNAPEDEPYAVNPLACGMLCACKMFATWITIGSGASGGIFSPSLVMGCCFGAAWGHGLNCMFAHFGMEFQVIVTRCCVASMAAMVSGGTGAVLTSMIMVFEMTLDYNAVLPIIITSVTAYATRKSLTIDSIYTLKLRRRGNHVPEGLMSAVDTCKCVNHVYAQKKHRVVASADEPVTPFNGVTFVGRESVEYTFVQIQAKLLEHMNPRMITYKQYAEVIEADVQTMVASPDDPYFPFVKLMHSSKAEVAIILDPGAEVTNNDHADVLMKDIKGVITYDELVASEAKTATLM